jgi:hypothetical protein
MDPVAEHLPSEDSLSDNEQDFYRTQQVSTKDSLLVRCKEVISQLNQEIDDEK